MRTRLAIISAVLVTAGVGQGAPPLADLFVSPRGDDRWSGRLAEPAPGGGDGPLASLEQARLRVASHGDHGKRPITVLIRGGPYAVAAPVRFAPEDGGADGAPVIYSAYPGETPTFDAGLRIVSWQPPSASDALARGDAALPPGLSPAAQAAVWSAPLPPSVSRVDLVTCNGTPLPISATTPSDDWEMWPRGRLGRLEGDLLQVAPADLPAGDTGPAAMLNWLPTPYTFWSNSRLPVAGLDPAKGQIALRPTPLHMPDALKTIPWRLENLASGIAGPGRWFADMGARRLYLWPPPDAPDPGAADIRIPGCPGVLIVEGTAEQPVRHMAFRGLTLSRTGLEPPDAAPGNGFSAPGSAIRLTGVEDIDLDGLTLEHLAGGAIRATGHVRKLRITGCTLRHLGGQGISIAGGLATPEPPARENLIAENLIHDVGGLYWHSPAIGLSLVAATLVRNNEIHHIPYTGIIIGNLRHRAFEGWPRPFAAAQAAWSAYSTNRPTIDAVKRFIPGHNRIERNLVHHTMMKLDDGGAIYCEAGHHNLMLNNRVYITTREATQGLYFDDEEMDSRMEDNVVYRVPDMPVTKRGSVVHVHDNGRNTIVNNILVGASFVFTFPQSYGGHVVERNIFVFGPQPRFLSSPGAVDGPMDGRRQRGWSAGPSVMDRNLFWSAGGEAAARDFLQSWQATGCDLHSIAADPCFRAPEAGDYTLAPDSPAIRRLGFRPIDSSGVGRTVRSDSSHPK